MSSIFNYLFYGAYISMIVLFGSLNGYQLTNKVKKSFNIFGLTVLLVISLDVTSLILGSNFVIIRNVLLYVEIIYMFIILFQLRKANLNKTSIYSYVFTLICLSTYCIYSLIQNFMHF